ncbi:MAG: serine/threonine protein kinase [Planctomycetes bacterium]|nr:serine/threonine protein kinase [Planctomycetota bacterium]
MIRPEAYARLGQLAWVHAPQGEADDETRIGRYRIVARIGSGSAGEVFHAVDPAGHPVAVKVLRRRVRRAGRYQREVEMLERISEREGVVALLEAGSCRRGPFIVLELAEGGSLRSRLQRDGPLGWEAAAGLVLQVARSLGVLHRDGIIHRDLKPENILLQGDGRPLLSDFGLAKDLGDEDGELTAAGFALGTIGYMAPELLDAQRELLGPWTDVFALGAVLFELVAGKPPFQGKTLNEAARSIREDAVPDLPGTPRALGEIIRRCLTKDAAGRYRDGAELAAALEPLLHPPPRPEDPAHDG